MRTDFQASDLSLGGLKLITPFYADDNRGFFLKSFEKDVFAGFGVDNDIYEDFESFSKKSVIRGLHFQTKNPQAKIVRVLWGEVLDVVVDLRKESPSFCRWLSVPLSHENRNILWIPKGFAHGFAVKSEEAVMSYKCIGKFSPETDSGICWNDPDLNIQWGEENPIVSEKDSKLMTLKTYLELF